MLKIQCLVSGDQLFCSALVMLYLDFLTSYFFYHKDHQALKTTNPKSLHT